MHKLQVGKPYIPEKTRWPEGAEYNWYDGGHELRIFLTQPSKAEIKGIRKGKARFGLFLAEHVLFLLARFGEVSWLDAPYNYHMLPPDRRPPLDDESTPETRVLLQILLVDAATGILHVIRATTLSPQFSRELIGAIREQATRPITRAEYDAAVDHVCAHYQTERMVRNAWVTCVGGE